MYRVIRSSEEDQAQGVLPYAENVLQDCVKNGVLIPVRNMYYNNRTGENYNYMYVKSIVEKSGNVYMCPVRVGDEDTLLFKSGNKIKVDLRQIELGQDKTELEWDSADPKFTLDYVVNRTKQWLNSNLHKMVGRVAPVLSRRYLPMNKRGKNLWIHEQYNYIMLLEKVDYDVVVDKNGIPGFVVNMSGPLFDVRPKDFTFKWKADTRDFWKSEGANPVYLGDSSITRSLESVALVTYPGSFTDFPTKDVVLNTIDNVNLSKHEINYAMSETEKLAKRNVQIPSSTHSNTVALLVTFDDYDDSYFIMLKNGKPVYADKSNTFVFQKDDSGYAIQYDEDLFYFNNAKDLSGDVDLAYLWETYPHLLSNYSVNLRKVRSKLLGSN